jgi:signal transduction histidine kinase
MTSLPDPAAWLLLLPTVPAGIAAWRYRRTAAACEKRVRALEEAAQAREHFHDRAVRARDEEMRHLAEHRVPALMNGLWQGRQENTPGPLHPQELAGTPYALAQEAVLAQFQGVALQAVERAEGAAQTAVKTVTRSMQGLLNEQQGAIIDMIRRHDDERVLADANAIDHAGNQLARRAQVFAVLTGSWPGRQRVASPLLDVARGGVSRIRDYHRVKITGEPSVAVVSRAVEPVVLAIAELLDNAARHSEPGSDVHVWFVQAHNGVSVMIDDAGVGLTPEARAQAARMLSGDDPVRLTQLRNPPKLGFAAVGALAKRYGFRASVDQESDFGGVRAVVYLPRSLLQPTASAAAVVEAVPAAEVESGGEHPPAFDAFEAAERAAGHEAAAGTFLPPADKPVFETWRTDDRPVRARKPAAPSSVPSSAPAATAPEEIERRPDGLPQRRRRHAGTGAPAQEDPGMQTPTAPSRSLGAFVRGRQAAKRSLATPEHGSEATFEPTPGLHPGTNPESPADEKDH